MHMAIAVITKEEPTFEVLSKTLQPFHEFGCDGINDEYVQTIDVLEELKNEYSKRDDIIYSFANYLSHCEYNGEHCKLDEDDEPDLDGDHQFGWFRVDKNGEVIEATHRTNPNSQWDWWVVGGRYSNRILRKSVEGEHDSAKVSDIDWEEMRKRSANKFNVNYLLGVFGYVKDGVWTDMGWDNDDESTWHAHLDELYKSIPEDHYITIVDCHV